MSEERKRAPMGKRNVGKIPGMRISKTALKRLLTYFGQYKARCIAVLSFIVLNAIITAGAALLLKMLMDDFITPMLSVAAAGGVPDFAPLLRMLIIAASVFVVGMFAGYMYSRLAVVVSQGILKKIRDEMFEHMQSLPIKYFDTHTHGDIMSYYTNDADALRQMMSQALPAVISSIISVTAVFFSMLALSVWLTIFVVIFTAGSLVLAGKIAAMSGKYFMAQQQAIGDLNGYIEEYINGQRVVKVFNYEEKATRNFEEKNEDLGEKMYRANKYANILMPVMGNLSNVLYVLLAIVGGALGIAGITNVSLTGVGLITLGSIVSFMQLSKGFMNPLAQVSAQINSVAMALAGAERIFTLLDEEPEVDDGYVTLSRVKRQKDGSFEETNERTGIWAWRHPHEDGSLTYTEVKGDIRFFNVDFGYTEEKIVLHDVSLYAKPGQKIAFVGATGAGKTTITNLINRFYDIADGKIRYDGININKIKKHDLRSSLGIVLQDVNLFTGTVMENIRYGYLNATDVECQEAAKRANADSFIRMLPEGYNTVLRGGGARLSQGQKQLISIARAAVADPPVMILDEATSSIDTRTEAIVQKGMDALMNGRTVFVIAHRLSTVKNSNLIMVLDGGRVIEKGNHEELIAERGTYYRLYTGAFELE
jgi:ATP-binding cassette subfamily B protein